MKFNKIYTSNQSTEVNFLSFNRAINSAHVNSIKESIEKHGWMGVCTFIYTNLYTTKGYKLYVLDGQHRVTAATMAGVPYRYEIKEVSTHEEVITLMADLNNNSSGWYLHDYLNAWITTGQKSYVNIRKIVNETNLPLAPLIAIYSKDKIGGENSSEFTQPFKRGSFCIKNRERADFIKDELVELKKAMKVKDTFMIAFAQFIIEKRASYDRARFTRAVKRNLETLNMISSAPDFRSQIAKMYKAA